MANALYGKYKEFVLAAAGSLDWDANNVKASLVDGGVYTPNMSTDDYYNDIASVVAVSGNLANKTNTLGVADADDVTWTSVSGAVSEYVIGWRDTATPATSELMWLMDTGTGLPVTPNGGDINVVWNASGIFAI
jgi:hypothetical protein